MTKTLFSVCLVLISCVLNSQQTNTNHNFKLGPAFTWFPSSYIHKFYGDESESRIHGREFYTAGITAIYSFNKNFALESGVTFAQYNVKVVPWGPERSGYMEKISILYLPLVFRHNFLNCFYASAGLNFEFDIGDQGGLKEQTGIGFVFGPGFNYDIRNKISVFVNPYMYIHSMVSFRYGPANDKIIEAAVRLGLLYRLW